MSLSRIVVLAPGLSMLRESPPLPKPRNAHHDSPNQRWLYPMLPPGSNRAEAEDRERPAHRAI